MLYIKKYKCKNTELRGKLKKETVYEKFKMSDKNIEHQGKIKTWESP